MKCKCVLINAVKHMYTFRVNKLIFNNNNGEITITVSTGPSHSLNQPSPQLPTKLPPHSQNECMFPFYL